MCTHVLNLSFKKKNVLKLDNLHTTLNNKNTYFIISRQKEKHTEISWSTANANKRTLQKPFVKEEYFAKYDFSHKNFNQYGVKLQKQKRSEFFWHKNKSISS